MGNKVKKVMPKMIVVCDLCLFKTVFVKRCNSEIHIYTTRMRQMIVATKIPLNCDASKFRMKIATHTHICTISVIISLENANK